MEWDAVGFRGLLMRIRITTLWQMKKKRVGLELGIIRVDCNIFSGLIRKSFFFFFSSLNYFYSLNLINNNFLHETEMLIILISSSGFSLYTFAFSILCTTSMPAIARPKIVCLLSSQGCIQVRIPFSYTLSLVVNWQTNLFLRRGRKERMKKSPKKTYSLLRSNKKLTPI